MTQTRRNFIKTSLTVVAGSCLYQGFLTPTVTESVPYELEVDDPFGYALLKCWDNNPDWARGPCIGNSHMNFLWKIELGSPYDSPPDWTMHKVLPEDADVTFNIIDSSHIEIHGPFVKAVCLTILIILRGCIKSGGVRIHYQKSFK